MPRAFNRLRFFERDGAEGRIDDLEQALLFPDPDGDVLRTGGHLQGMARVAVAGLVREA